MTVPLSEAEGPKLVIDVFEEAGETVLLIRYTPPLEPETPFCADIHRGDVHETKCSPFFLTIGAPAGWQSGLPPPRIPTPAPGPEKGGS